MEHIMSEKMFERMTKLSEFIQNLSSEHPEMKEKLQNLYK